MEIKILNLKFEIQEVTEISHGSENIGETDHIKQIIYIKKSLSPERKKIVLLHEILHSIFEQLGFDEQHDDELLINALSTALYRVLVDNTLFWFSTSLRLR